MTAEALGSLVPEDVRALLRTQSLRLGRPIYGRGFGRHASTRVGPGREFRDHRPYVPGDDPRRLDWKAFARRDRLVLRQTESEDELTLALLVDGGGGMGYGAGAEGKFTFAASIAASLAYLAHAQGDPVVYAMRGGPLPATTTLRLRRASESLATLAEALRHHRPSGVSAWTELLEAASHVLPPGSLVVVLSDLLDPGGRGRPEDDERMLAGLQHLRARRHDVLLVQVLHRDEVDFPWTEDRPLRFVDLWNQRPPVEGAALAMRSTYLEALQTHLRAWDDEASRRGLMLERITTNAPLAETIARLLRRLGEHRASLR